jgi:hypothetical protein
MSKSKCMRKPKKMLFVTYPLVETLSMRIQQNPPGSKQRIFLVA